MSQLKKEYVKKLEINNIERWIYNITTTNK